MSALQIKCSTWFNHSISIFQVEFSVALAAVPVDIYFVMDLSNSMSIHKDNLVKAAEKIADRVQLLTSDYTLGFGSFSDKPTAPFSSELPYYATAKGKERRKNQPPPYAFKHHQTLSKNVRTFKEGVNNAKLAGNIDSPESGKFN